MSLYYGFLSLATLFLRLRDFFNDWGKGINKVFLVGETLSPYLFSASTYFYALYAKWVEIAQTWLSIYNQLAASVTLPAVITKLSTFADDIISIVRYFDDWVLDTIRRRFPTLYNLANNTVNTVLDIVTRYTGLDSAFLANPRNVILGLVQSALQGVSAFLANPAAFIVNSLSLYYPLLAQVLQNPDGWLITRVQALFPALADFIRNPGGYILTRIEQEINQDIARVSKIVQGLAVKILEYIW